MTPPALCHPPMKMPPASSAPDTGDRSDAAGHLDPTTVVLLGLVGVVMAIAVLGMAHC